ncbi:opioid growth factor receptor-like protein 1 isoform X2 [Ruditapes philippinarum]|uniref:opioid growth factor receptor-like protein 1 isoform X2 n=1 Tax=Ruditapes philippinarum TaxID=129788 RepID=UPI00295BF277|nr:opioid growth factor receptor-like protein 1 isoform X2 [Ruditapes philippinarum]
MGNLKSKSKKEGKESSVDPAKYGATGGTSKGSGQSREVSTKAGTRDSYGRNVSLFSHEKPLSYGAEPYGYKVLSPAEARHYRDNVDFYKNVIRSKPLPGHTIEDMLKWKGNYEMLERNHSYIQWLFPIPESNGLNMYAQQLFEHEAKAIREDDGAQKRVLRAYKMMLDFYGMKLKDNIYGLVARSDKGWQDRYEHLNRSRHNLLRVTRILKSLGELGYERFQARWVEFLIDEAVINRVLPNLNGPCLMHWVMAVKDDGEREMLYRKANGLDIDEHNTQYGSDSESGSGDDEIEEKLKYDRPNISAEPDLSELNLDNNGIDQKGAQQNKHSGDQKINMQTDKAVNSMITSPLSKPQMVKPNDISLRDQSKLFKDDKTSVDAKAANSSSSLGVKPKTEKQNKQQARDETDKRSIDDATLHDKVTEGTDLPSDNLKFYRNEILSRPASGFNIKTMLKYKGEYDFFDEKYPEFIQWLFPVPDSVGRNREAQPLYEHEAKEIRCDDKLRERVLKAFKMMLDYFGMTLDADCVGIFGRSKNYKERYDYLQRYPISYYRITRIIKSIGELGFDRFQVPWIDFLIEEGIDKAMFPTLNGPCIQHWINAIKDDGEKHAMVVKHKDKLDLKAVDDRGEEMDVCWDDEETNAGRISPLFYCADCASSSKARWIP